jgi:hypothetical protein
MQSLALRRDVLD